MAITGNGVIQGRDRCALHRWRGQDFNYSQREQPKHKSHNYAGWKALRHQISNLVFVGCSWPVADDSWWPEALPWDSERSARASRKRITLDSTRHPGDFCQRSREISGGV